MRGLLFALIFASSASCAVMGTDVVPWECDCKADPDHCAGDQHNVAECSALVEVAKLVGFHNGKPYGAQSSLLNMDPIASHTIGCHCCWGNGVQCSGDGEAKIIALHWGGKGLSGMLPSSINKLANLGRIDVSSNSLIGPLPQLKLPFLEYFWASSNSLTGGFPTFDTPNLWQLFLNDNQLTGSLPHGLDLTMPKLRRFEIDGNNFGGAIPSDIPFWNNTNANLQGSSISCGFSGNHWSCPIQPWMRQGPGYGCNNITCVGALFV